MAECPHGMEDPSWCSICKHGVSRPEPVTVEAVFRASFDGFCNACNLGITAGTLIARLSNERYVHEYCVEVSEQGAASPRLLAALSASVWVVWFGTRGWPGAVSYAAVVVLAILGIVSALRKGEANVRGRRAPDQEVHGG